MTRTLEMEARLRNRALRRDLKDGERMIGAWSKGAGSKVREGFKLAAGSLATFGTAAGIQAAASEAIDFERTLTRIGIQAGGKANLGELRAQAAQLSDEFGISKRQVLGALDAIVNLEGASGVSADKMRLLAMAATGTGAPIEELAGVSFALNNAFKFKNAADAERAMSAVIEAGKQGSIPLGEMSTVLQQLATKFAAVSDEGAAGAAQLAAILQIGRKGFGSAAEAGTGLKAFLDQLEQSEAKLRAHGVTVKKVGKDGKRRFLPLAEILDQLQKKGVTNSKTFTRMFGSTEARQFLRTIEDNRAELDKLTAAAMNSNAVQADAQAFLRSDAGKLQKSMERVKGAFVALLTPERLAKFAAAAEVAADVAGLLADNLELVIAAVVGFKAVQGALAFRQMAHAASALGPAATSAAGGIGAVGKSAAGLGKLDKIAGAIGPLALAAAGGWELGRALDQALGLSDKLGSSLAAFTGEDEAGRTAKAQAKEKTENKAISTLRESGAIEGRVVSSEVVASLRAKEAAGAQTPAGILGQTLSAKQLGLTEQEAAARDLLNSGLGITEDDARAQENARAMVAAVEAGLGSLVAGRLAGVVGDRAKESGNTSIEEIHRALGETNILGTTLQRDTEAQERNTQLIIAELQALNKTLSKRERISLEIDGENVLAVTKNTPARRRAPAK